MAARIRSVQTEPSARKTTTSGNRTSARASPLPTGTATASSTRPTTRSGGTISARCSGAAAWRAYRSRRAQHTLPWRSSGWSRCDAGPCADRPSPLGGWPVPEHDDFNDGKKSCCQRNEPPTTGPSRIGWRSASSHPAILPPMRGRPRSRLGIGRRPSAVGVQPSAGQRPASPGGFYCAMF